VVNNRDFDGKFVDDVMNDLLGFLGWFLQTDFDFNGDQFDVFLTVLGML